MIIHEENTNPAFRFKGLVRSVFGKCSKNGDPWAYAAQDHYTQFMPEPPTLYAKRALPTVVIKMIIDHKANKAIVDKLKILEDQVWDLKNQKGSIALIDKLIDTARDLDY
jgi:hypothetical protein